MNESVLTDRLIHDIGQWHIDRNLIDGATDKDQVCKLYLYKGIDQ